MAGVAVAVVCAAAAQAPVLACCALFMRRVTREHLAGPAPTPLPAPGGGSGGGRGGRLSHARTVKALFVFSLWLASCLFQLLMLEVLDAGDRQYRRLAWQCCIYGMEALLLVVLPYAQIYLRVSNSKRFAPRVAVLVSAAACGCWLLCVWKLLSLPTIFGEGSSVPNNLCIIGVIVVALLSGYGAVNGPFNYITYSLRKVMDSDLIEARHKLLCEMDHATSQQDSQSRSAECDGRLRRPGSEPFRASEVDDAFRGYADELANDLTALDDFQARVAFSKTVRGRLFNLLGYYFAAYCSYKVVMATVTVCTRRRRFVDPATRVLDLALRVCHVSAFVDTTLLVQYLSLALIGAMIFTSIKGFFSNLLKVAHSSQRSSPVWNSHFLLLVGHVTGMYFLSSVVLMRTSLPEQYRTIISEVVDIKFGFVHDLFDVVFVLCALTTFAVLVCLRRLSRAKAIIHDWD
eukprot:TRINITY_DN360_c0_g1_i1.p1 TRINITY_DN360_c0_g1~~TRINITY_DN360_c0_g1_i1.p1  ORF type:complete len:460 (-),score=102.77 TRINITY_DN360_c0_g1_i1:2152-3531(-)